MIKLCKKAELGFWLQADLFPGLDLASLHQPHVPEPRPHRGRTGWPLGSVLLSFPLAQASRGENVLKRGLCPEHWAARGCQDPGASWSMPPSPSEQGQASQEMGTGRGKEEEGGETQMDSVWVASAAADNRKHDCF